MYQECRHIKTSGTKCGSPALTGKAYCFFHFRAHQQRHRTVDHYAAFVSHKFEVPVLEDRAAIQLAISETVAAMAGNYMDPKRGGKILYGLQLALNGIKHPQEILAPEPVRELCQNDEGEDIAPEMTVYEEGEDFPDDEEEEEEEEDQEEEEQGEHKEGDDGGETGEEEDRHPGPEPPEPLACAGEPTGGGPPKSATLREFIANYIAELRQRNPEVQASKRPITPIG